MKKSTSKLKVLLVGDGKRDRTSDIRNMSPLFYHLDYATIYVVNIIDFLIFCQ